MSSANVTSLPVAGVLVALGLHAVPCIAAPSVTFRPGWNMFSPQQDVDLGRQNAAEADKQLPLLKDARVEGYIAGLGRYLSFYAPNNRSEYVWQFQVVNSSEINAFALPGGFVYVNRATIESAQNEAQLAGVIAHEEGHVVMRHGTHQASEQMLAQAPLAIVGGLLGQESSLMNQVMKLGIGLGVNSLFLHNSREAETQADEVGAYILYQAGYDPHAMAQFFEIIEQKYPQKTLQFLSDHPSPGNRIQNVDAEIPSLGPVKTWRTDSTEFQAAKRRMGGMPAPEGPSAPVLASVTLPSVNYKLLRHADFSISYPDNWEVLGGESSTVTIAPRAGLTSNAVVCGAIISAYESKHGRTSSLEDSTHELISTLRQANPELQVVSHEQNVPVNGHRAESVQMLGNSPVRDAHGQQRRERDWLVAIERGGGALEYVVFIAPESDFRSLQPAFERMLNSLQLK